MILKKTVKNKNFFFNFGIANKTILKLFKKFGLNLRLNYIHLKNKHKFKIFSSSSNKNLSGRLLKNRLLQFNKFYQQIRIYKKN